MTLDTAPESVAALDGGPSSAVDALASSPAGPSSGFPPLAPPPEPEGAWKTLEPWTKSAFRQLNRWLMTPAIRAGLGAWLGTPVGGYILLLRVRGRRSGVMRETPLSYLVADGSAWVLAGFGVRTEWYRNLLVDPRVEVWLPGRTLAARAEEILDPAVRARILPDLARAAGVPGALIGVNPFTAPDGAIVHALAWVPLVRLTPLEGPLVAGPDDPGGHAWIWRQAFVLWLTVVLLRAMPRGKPRGDAS